MLVKCGEERLWVVHEASVSEGSERGACAAEPGDRDQYQGITLVVYENSETKLKVWVIRWGSMEPVPYAVVIA